MYKLGSRMDTSVEIEISRHARASGIIWVNDRDDTFDIPLDTAVASKLKQTVVKMTVNSASEKICKTISKGMQKGNGNCNKAIENFLSAAVRMLKLTSWELVALLPDRRTKWPIAALQKRAM